MVFPVPVPARCRGRGNGNEDDGSAGGGLEVARAGSTRGGGWRRESVAGGIMQEASGAGEHTESLVECRVPYATEHAQLTERHRTASRFEHGSDALVEADRGSYGFVRPLEYAECESGAVLLEFDCQRRW